jgi:hypothetical protein
MWPLSDVRSLRALLPRSDVCAAVRQVERWLDEDGHVLQPSNFKYPQVRWRTPPHRAARLGSARLSSARLTQVRQCDPLCDSLISHVRMCVGSVLLCFQFNAGPRLCLGKQMAINEAKVRKGRHTHMYIPRALAHMDPKTSHRLKYASRSHLRLAFRHSFVVCAIGLSSCVRSWRRRFYRSILFVSCPAVIRATS